MENPSIIISAIALAFNLGATLVVVTWKLSRMELAIRQAITDARKDIDNDLDRQSREFGEVVSALRSKITEVELWSRDNFARRDSFHLMKDELSDSIKHLGEKIDIRVDRLEAKVNNKTAPRPQT